jgi:hypothetical protein
MMQQPSKQQAAPKIIEKTNRILTWEIRPHATCTCLILIKISTTTSYLQVIACSLLCNHYAR